MTKFILILSTLILVTGCNEHHGHGDHIDWNVEVKLGEEGVSQTLPVIQDHTIIGVPYSPVSFEAMAPVKKGSTIKRAFALSGQGEQRVLTEVVCDASKASKEGVAGEATLNLLGVMVRFYCSL